MANLEEKTIITYRYFIRVMAELLLDLFLYYTSSYPLLLIIGAFKRIKRRIKYLWFPKGPGRPPVPENIVDLILDMKRSNLLWGALRISQELKLMRISLHKKTISNILKENGFSTPPMKHQPPTWEALLAEGKEVWAMDFCNIIDLKLFQIYIIGIINIHSREIVWQAITIHPDREWILQQFKNISINGTPFPRYLIIDNDSIYGNWMTPILHKYFDIKTLRITKGCPWQNGIMERYWKTLQIELVDRLHIQDESSIRYFCNIYKQYYNETRPHQGIFGFVPSEPSQQKASISNLHLLKYEKVKHAHGLFTEFKLVA